jgi:uncharacterized protein (DUF1800 family)
MELFTLGRGPSQTDVVAAAHLLPVWEVMKVPEKPGPYNPDAMRAVYASEHGLQASSNPRFNDGVAFLGGSGIRDIPGVINRILANPACAAFLVHKLCATFLQAQPSPDDEATVATPCVARTSRSVRH